MRDARDRIDLANRICVAIWHRPAGDRSERGSSRADLDRSAFPYPGRRCLCADGAAHNRRDRAEGRKGNPEVRLEPVPAAAEFRLFGPFPSGMVSV